MTRSRRGVPASVGPFNSAACPPDCNCTCATPVMEPGRLFVAMTVVPVKGPGASDGARATAGPCAITPVPSAGVAGPKPLRKTVTTEPALAGLAQSFTVPSAFRANAACPKACVVPHVDSGNVIVAGTTNSSDYPAIPAAMAPYVPVTYVPQSNLPVASNFATYWYGQNAARPIPGPNDSKQNSLVCVD